MQPKIYKLLIITNNDPYVFSMCSMCLCGDKKLLQQFNEFFADDLLCMHF
jgi:hypothetical protein